MTSQAFTFEPEELLRFLRWGADSQIVNHFGEHVWLGQRWTCRVETREENGYITDCCFVDAPCSYHHDLERSAA